MPGTAATILERIAHRPMQWFLLLWLMLTVLRLLAGLGGLSIEQRPARPPRAQSVPYQNYLPGGKKYEADSLNADLDQKKLPRFNPSPADADYMFTLWSNEHDPGDYEKAQIVAQRHIVSVQYGWPREWFEWLRVASFNVTDPSQPFEFASTQLPERVIHPDGAIIHWRATHNNGGIIQQSTLYWTRPIGQLLLIELCAGGLVFSAWCVHVRRQRRRLLHNRCLACGYDRRGLADDSVCPECGADAPDAELHQRAVAAINTPRHARWFVSLWLILIILWLGISAIAVQKRSYESPEVQIRETRMRLQRSGSRVPTQYTVQMLDDNYGWPIRWFRRSAIRRYTWIRGREPLAKTFAPDHEIVMRDDHIQFQDIGRDKKTIQLTSFYWPHALLQIALMQFIALPLAVPAALLGRRVRCRRMDRARRRAS